MIMVSSLLRCMVLVIVVVDEIFATSSLSFLISPGNDECLYLQKKSGDQITASFQVIQGSDVSFKMLDPKQNVIYEKTRSEGYDLNQQIHIGGDYGFCFSNAKSREETGVHFEWDYHLGNQDEATFKKKLEEEKRKYLMNKINENKPKVIVGDRNSGVKPVEMHQGGDNNPLYHTMSMDSMAHATILLSFNFDRILHYMSLHKSKMALSHHVQLRNASYISYYSIGISSLIVVMGLIQVVVVKSFFSNKLTWKVWEF